jgi:peptidoglycan hydrolase-like protein with peptidoglycan-binding domain
MKNILIPIKGKVSAIRKSRIILASLVLGSLTSLGFTQMALAVYYEPIGTQLDEGEQNQDVTRLQTFIRDNPSIYPEGLVTGYYGSLTKKAVIRFQSQYGISQVGRVGPATRDKMNDLINGGGWNGGGSNSSDMSGPYFSSMTYGITSNSLSFTFNTNEPTRARVVYDTNPLRFNEGDINSNGFGPIGGFGVTSASNESYSHSITIPSLNSNTVYYYTVIATDIAGNVSVWGPNNMQRTSN